MELRGLSSNLALLLLSYVTLMVHLLSLLLGFFINGPNLVALLQGLYELADVLRGAPRKEALAVVVVCSSAPGKGSRRKVGWKMGPGPRGVQFCSLSVLFGFLSILHSSRCLDLIMWLVFLPLPPEYHRNSSLQLASCAS